VSSGGAEAVSKETPYNFGGQNFGSTNFGSTNFGGLPEEFTEYKKSRFVILPVPFDKTSTWIKGTDRGPDSVIDASRNLELYDMETDSEVYKRGIHTTKAICSSDSLSMIKKVYQAVKKCHQDGKFVVILGGEHTVALGGIKAWVEHTKTLSVLQLDAHTDMRDIYDNNRYSHACVMARAKELTQHIVAVGVRSSDSSELKNIDKDNTFTADIVHSSKNWVKRVIRRLTGTVYVTIDLDVLDPGVMPSTGAPEPGGLTWYQITKLLRAVAVEKNVVGFDVVELCPSDNRAPDFLAAKLVYKFLSYIQR
jgi:agmatinase